MLAGYAAQRAPPAGAVRRYLLNDSAGGSLPPVSALEGVASESQVSAVFETIGHNGPRPWTPQLGGSLSWPSLGRALAEPWPSLGRALAERARLTG